MSHPENITFKFGHHTKSDKPHLELFKGYFYKKYFACTQFSFPRPPVGSEKIKITCPVCNDTVTIRLSSAETVSAFNKLYRTIAVLIAAFTIFLLLRYPDLWDILIFWPGIFVVIFWFMYRYKASIVNDFNFNFYGHEILWTQLTPEAPPMLQPVQNVGQQSRHSQPGIRFLYKYEGTIFSALDDVPDSSAREFIRNRQAKIEKALQSVRCPTHVDEGSATITMGVSHEPNRFGEDIECCCSEFRREIDPRLRLTV